VQENLIPRSLQLSWLLAWQDILQAYRRSAVGPFWLTIGFGVQILTMGFVFGMIFQAEVRVYIPYLAVSLVLWGLIASTVNDGCMSFIAAESTIKQLNLPHIVYVSRSVLKNLFTTAHNLVLVPIVYLVFMKPPGLSLFLIVPGLLILVLNLGWVVLLLGISSARFRDVPPIIGSVTTIGFFVTPVMWSPDLIGNNELAHLLLGLNPLYHWLQIVRLPILGQWPTLENWGVALLVAGIGWGVTLLVYRKYRTMIAYWV
jgi:lipopolysaccharide transport system permease protein